MKKPKHITWVRILMLLSQLLLTAFVIQWIFSQFAVEKATLKKELQRQMSESQQEVIDTMLMVHLIDPMLKDKKSIQVQMDISDQPEPRKGHDLTKESPALTKKCLPMNTNFFAISSLDSLKVGIIKDSAHIFYRDQDNLMLHSIRLMVRQATDSLGVNDPLKIALDIQPDTGLFKKIFLGKIDAQGWKFLTTLISGKRFDSVVNHGSAIYLECRIFSSPVGAEVRHYTIYLLKRIAPQVLFALILLMLTGTAFYISYRSLKNQIMLNSLRNDFISNISHELKTPVATVKVALEALRNFDMKKDPAVTSEYLQMASLEMDRLDLLITKVLNTSLLEENQLITLETTNLKSLVQEVLTSMQPRFTREQAIVNLEANEEYYYANLDKLHLHGVLINLIDNSLKYAQEKPSINLRIEQTDSLLCLTVSDNGPGIPEAHIHKVFDKFFRVPSGDRHNVKGHGLGLSYAAMVMKQHRGSIRVENLEGGGCAFKLIFPKR